MFSNQAACMEMAHNAPVSAVFAVNCNQCISSFSSRGIAAIGGTFYDSSTGQRERRCGDPCSRYLTHLKTMRKKNERKEHPVTFNTHGEYEVL